MPSSGPSSDIERRPDRRTRGRERRRDALYAAAATLFVERGFDNTTVDDIAERADVARATVFNHFRRKTDFVDEWSARRRKRAFEALPADKFTDTPLRTVLVTYFTELGRISTASRAETVAFMSAAVHQTNVLGRPELATELSRFVAHARDAGELDPQTSPRRVGLLLAATYFATLTAWVVEEPIPFDLTEELLSSLDILLSGITPQPDQPAER
ncbi:TetR/AcrR family transcriptional regulator [Dactylosporangium sp. CA-092794]|uniref:TetR/AcrR family transcriptional regulator n=1 Tax=Dactylosporangium sp. CA-092794 TaxID=3239929 RepID=UPI003D8BFAF7